MAWDSSQYVIVEDPTQCDASATALALEASRIESQAMQDDRCGRLPESVAGYRRAAAKLKEAGDACPKGHVDRQTLEQHAVEVLSRADYLENLKGNVSERLHLEVHIRAVELTLGCPDAALWVAAKSSRVQPSKQANVMSAAAIISGATGLLALGPFTGIALGAATAYATTREDQAGSAARKVGALGMQIVNQAKSINREHHISQRVVSVTAQTPQAISSFNKKHKVTEKLGWGLTSATSAFTAMVIRQGGRSLGMELRALP